MRARDDWGENPSVLGRMSREVLPARSRLGRAKRSRGIGSPLTQAEGKKVAPRFFFDRHP
jgi:hypothetical protein